MCTISFSVTRANGIDISSVQVRHRRLGELDWGAVSNTSVLNPTTADITVIGTYELQVRIGDSSGAFSDWTDAPGTFEVSRDCTGTPIVLPDGPAGDGEPIIAAPDTSR